MSFINEPNETKDTEKTIKLVFKSMAEEKITPLNIGVDFGGVCSAHAEKYESTEKNASKQVELINVKGCEETLRALRAQGHKLFLVSFCGRSRADNTRAYLQPLGLFDELFFVKDRKYKQNICLLLGLDVLIDDRLDVLETINPTQTMLFTGVAGAAEKYEQPAVYKDKKTGKFIQYKKFEPDFVANDWAHVLQLIPSVKSLRLLPDNQVKTNTICYL